jgi:ADP-heptose:LPS heptosyltransferase
MNETTTPRASASRPLNTVEVRRVAVFRALQLGDLLCAVPALRALRGLLPQAEVTLIGLPWARAFAERFTRYIDGFIEFPGHPALPERPFDAEALPRFLSEARAKNFDLAIQLHGSGPVVNEVVAGLGARRTAGFFVPGSARPDPDLFIPWPEGEPEPRRLLRLMEALGAVRPDEGLEFPVGPEDERDLREAGVSLPAGGYACVHPGAQLPSRRWPVERFAAAADALAAAGLSIVLTGTESERGLTSSVRSRMRSPALDLAGKSTLGSLAALLRDARLLLSNDTGLSHLAAALRVPSVIVASGSDVGRWAPSDRARHKVLFHPVDCRPCSHAECPVDGHPCAAGVSVRDVLREALPLAAEEAAPCAV